MRYHLLLLDGKHDMALVNQIASYWEGRVHPDYIGSYMYVSLDVTAADTKDELLTRTFTKLNIKEADLIAATVLDMLTAAVPASTN